MTCDNCENAVKNHGNCLMILGFDGCYTWGTPIPKDWDEYWPYDVIENARPSKEGECFNFQEAKKP